MLLLVKYFEFEQSGSESTFFLRQLKLSRMLIVEKSLTVNQTTKYALSSSTKNLLGQGINCRRRWQWSAVLLILRLSLKQVPWSSTAGNVCLGK